MAMTGMRRVSVGLGLVEETPPEELVQEGPPELVAKIPPQRRGAIVELVHWSVGAAGGAVFSLLPQQLRRRPLVGPAYGLAIFAAFEGLIRPVIDAPQPHRIAVRERLAIGADHVLYGLILGERVPPRG